MLRLVFCLRRLFLKTMIVGLLIGLSGVCRRCGKCKWLWGNLGLAWVKAGGSVEKLGIWLDV